MAINMKALRKRLTPVSPEQADEAMAASVAAHLDKYGQPPKNAVCLESPVKAAEDASSTMTEHDMNQRRIPDDFPRNLDPGSVAGVQPKILVREDQGLYKSGLTDDELWTRYVVCEDVAVQLSEYVRRKMADAGLSADVALSRAAKGSRLKVDSGKWDFSLPEFAWVTKRTEQLVQGDRNVTQGRTP
ncbi:hypothetical protein [Burkholderia cepacia]|uniref:hypothetical protein n=1 Tax=Burkholderia cepacia TaxID=292 RepID=UPI002ABD1F8F|nr:hypothetical protein [Burkholderia cepacia]